VGHSIGGMTIQTLARDDAAYFNRKVAGTVLVNTSYTNPLKTMILSGLAQAIRWPLLEPLMRLGIVLQPLVWLSAWQSYLSGSSHMANRLGFGKYVRCSAGTRLAPWPRSPRLCWCWRVM
jgi:pimeloyl-ACP methyl ester carboxylesterase